jgi:hypothetical protein
MAQTFALQPDRSAIALAHGAAAAPLENRSRGRLSNERLFAAPAAFDRAASNETTRPTGPTVCLFNLRFAVRHRPRRSADAFSADPILCAFPLPACPFP